MTVDLAGFSPKELDALISKARQRKQTLAKRSSVAEVRKALAGVAKKHGWTLEEVFGAGAKSAPSASAAKSRKAATGKSRTSATKGAKVPPKYRHPTTDATWSGRGIVPKWMAAEISNGKSREDFLI